MKKTLVAIAALAVTSAFAQSAVTLTGNLDFAYGTASQGTSASQKTISTRDLTSSTSVINITATEDLGGGNAATVKYGIDPRKFARDAGGTPTSDETYVGLAGGLGNLRLGSPNSIGLEAFGASTPFGTGIGGGYGSTVVGYTSFIRYTRSARYDSPSFSGVTAHVLKAQGSDAAVAGSLYTTAGNITEAAGGKTELGLKYANGPLNIAFANVQVDAYSTTQKKTAAKTLAANYNLGAATVYVGTVSGDLLSDATGATTTKGSNAAVKYTMGQIDLLAGYTTRKDSGADKQTVTGLRADYNFSKTTATYIGYQDFKAPTTANNQKLVSIGLRKSF